MDPVHENTPGSRPGAGGGTPAGLDLLARPGANPQVAEKKVLLAFLAGHEALRLGLAPDPARCRALAAHFRAEMDLPDEAALAGWLADAGLGPADFDALMADFAAVLAVEARYRDALAGQLDRHRRFMAAREARLARLPAKE